jgi:tetratricopeptide (TPR) repeat protein
LYREFADRNFTIVAVAFDAGGPDAVREFIRPREPILVPAPMRAIMSWSAEQYDGAAAPTYPCLIDERHVVAELYDMKNVPMAVWIDEDGRIVRPPEPAGATDGFRSMDRKTFTLPDEVAEAGRASRARYVAALRDWIERGSQSRFALSEDEARGRVAGPTASDALAAANFKLGHYLRERGEPDRAKPYFDEAVRLCPDRWTYFRQALQLEEVGKASGPEFVAKLRSLGERRYYEDIRLD